MECSQFRGVWFTRSGRLHCAPVVWRAEPEDARDWHHRHQRQNLMRSLDCARLDGGGHALRDQRNARLRHARSIDRNGIYHAACAANAAQSCATGSVRRSRRCARSLLACAASEACERRYLRYRRVYHLSRDHLDYHGTLEAYETAKAHLFEGPDLQTAVVNRDDPVGQRILARLQTNRAVRKIAYGIGEPGGAPPADTV